MYVCRYFIVVIQVFVLVCLIFCCLFLLSHYQCRWLPGKTRPWHDIVSEAGCKTVLSLLHCWVFRAAGRWTVAVWTVWVQNGLARLDELADHNHQTLMQLTDDTQLLMTSQSADDLKSSTTSTDDFESLTDGVKCLTAGTKSSVVRDQSLSCQPQCQHDFSLSCCHLRDTQLWLELRLSDFCHCVSRQCFIALWLGVTWLVFHWHQSVQGRI